jgi:hypothetical protein
MTGRLCLVLATCLAVSQPALTAPYNAPTVDGHVTTGPGDWFSDELAADDPPDDCRWGPTDADLDDLYVTWDESALYVGITTVNGPSGYGNGYLLFIDADAQTGITGAVDFSGADFYPRMIVFDGLGADAMAGLWSLQQATLGIRHCDDPTNTVPITGAFVDPVWKHIELAIPWDGLYGLGPGLVPPGTALRLVAAIVGGDGSGAYDAMPTSSSGLESDPDTPWNASVVLDVFVDISVDTDGDGVPDPGASPVSETSWGRMKHRFAQ